MIILSERIEIDAPSTMFVEWLSNIQQNYRHIGDEHSPTPMMPRGLCRLFGEKFEKGASLYFEGYFAGNFHNSFLAIISADPDDRIELRSSSPLLLNPRLILEIKPYDESFILYAMVCLGSDFPIMGALLDAIVWMVWNRSLLDTIYYMRKGLENLKQDLEKKRKSVE